MKDSKKSEIRLDPNGFNELQMCRSGPMLYNKNDTFIGRSLQQYGEFSIGEQELFSQIAGAGECVVEVGANIGAHTVELSRLVGNAGRVYAFEPQRIVFQTLCANLALNQCTNVLAQQAAVGQKFETLFAPPVHPSVKFNFGGISLREVDAGDAVPVVPLDSMELRALKLLKIDVEGMETDVLVGAEHTIWTCRPIMYVENDRAARSEELLTLVERLGYKAFWHVPALFRPNNFYGNSDDIFGNVVSVNILCVPEESAFVISGLDSVTSTKDWWRDHQMPR